MPDTYPNVRVPLRDVPPGLVAIAVTTSDGAVPRDRKGRRNPKRIVVVADGTQPPYDPGTDPGLTSPDDWRWLTAAPTRRWATVSARLGAAAWETAAVLARGGVVTIACAVDGLRLGEPTGIALTPAWAERCRQDRDGRTQHVIGLRDRAVGLASDLEPVDTALAAALANARGHEKNLPVLLAAADDLLAGVAHDGPRAFSQAHFGHTKARDDAPAILAAAGVAPKTLAALGLTRSPYVGLGGAIVVSGPTGQTGLSQFPGPVQFRVDRDREAFLARLEPDDHTVTLAVVENLQAAETVCDASRGEVAVVWCAGQPSDRALEVIASLAARSKKVVVAPDADWGGARIASRVVGALPPGTAFCIVDCGTARHEPRDLFGPASREGLAAIERTATDENVRAFAAAVRARGYPVEQEASARAVLTGALR